MSTNRKGYLKEYYARERRKIIVALGGQCANCGVTHGLEIAHKRKTSLSGRGRGMLNRLTDWKRHLEDYILFCRPCHVEVDNDG